MRARTVGLLIAVACLPLLAGLLLLAGSTMHAPAGPVVTPQTYGYPRG